MPSNSHRHIHAPHIHAWLMQLHSRSTYAAALRPQHLYRRAHAATLFRMSHAAAFMQHLARGGIFRSQHSRCSSHAANSLSHLRCRSHATAFTLLRRCSSRALAQALCSGGGGGGAGFEKGFFGLEGRGVWCGSWCMPLGSWLRGRDEGDQGRRGPGGASDYRVSRLPWHFLARPSLAAFSLLAVRRPSSLLTAIPPSALTAPVSSLACHKASKRVTKFRAAHETRDQPPLALACDWAATPWRDCRP